MSETKRRSPYQGLIPFDEEDAPFFFGREKETRLIIANIFASPLTLLYGASGVGKSSVLRAGVARELRERGDLLVVVFNAWQSDPLLGLEDAIVKSASRIDGKSATASATKSFHLAGFLADTATRLNRRVMVILDQFEEYFLYHSRDAVFAEQFSKAVTQRDLPVSFLISIREESYARLDRFEGLIPNLFDNYLRLEHLDHRAATDAIVKPVEQYNHLLAKLGAEISVEPILVDSVIKQVKTGEVTIGEVGRGRIIAPSIVGVEVEAPYLQLVMTRLWDEEVRADSRVLRVKTLERLGGAERIVQAHLDEVMNTLSRNEQDTAARVFFYLVTPSGSKIAHTAADLAQYSKTEPVRLESLLSKLSGSPIRILQAFATPSQPTATRYEIFHDVLASAILAWRSRYLQSRRQPKFWSELIGRSLITLMAVFIFLINLPLVLNYANDIVLSPRSVNAVFAPAEIGARAIIRYDPILRPNDSTPTSILVDVDEIAVPLYVTFSSGDSNILRDGVDSRRFDPPSHVERYSFSINQPWVQYAPLEPAVQHRKVFLIFESSKGDKPSVTYIADFRMDNYPSAFVALSASIVALITLIAAAWGSTQWFHGVANFLAMFGRQIGKVMKPQT